MRTLIILIALFGFCGVAQAKPIDDNQAVRAILGEARGEGYEGMYAVACAIRNRGDLKGVYGLKANMPDLTPEIWQKASKAWFNSLSGVDVTHGANHWENAGSFGVPYWAKGKTPTVVIGHHRFYKL